MSAVCYVYVLRNPQGRCYIGLSEDVNVRLGQHNAGLSQWTAKFRPWTLVWTSAPLTLSDARRLENLLKRQKGGAGLYRITRMPRPSSSGS